MNNNSITIAIDFDGSVVRHEYPEVGGDIGAVPVLKRLVKAGHKLILWTMRCDQSPDGKKGYHLQAARKWFETNDIPLYGVQCNPTQRDWTSSEKCYAQLYIDDAGLGCPLIYPIDGSRPYVDWIEVKRYLIHMGLIEAEDGEFE